MRPAAPWRCCKPSQSLGHRSGYIRSAPNPAHFTDVASTEIVRIVSLCLALAGAEMLHGIARTVLLAPRVGKERAIKLSIVSGTALAFMVCYGMVPGIGLRGWGAHGLLGVGLAVFMAGFDMAIGRFVMRLKWPRIWRDFNPAHGNYLSVGLLMLCGMPALVGWIQGGLGVA